MSDFIAIKFHVDGKFKWEENWQHVPRTGDAVAIRYGDAYVFYRVIDIAWIAGIDKPYQVVNVMLKVVK